MAIRTGTEYLESIRDGRNVWLAGDKVADVTTHPALAGCAQALAETYDLQFDPAYKDVLTMPSPSTGEPVSAGYLLPRSLEDLQRRRQLTELLARHSGATAGRLNEYLSIILVGLYDARDILAEANPAFAENATAYFEYCRENDLCVTHAFIDPERDRSRPPSDFEFLKVVEKRADGIVIRGGKEVATLSPYSNELVGLTLGRPGLQPEEVIYFATPVDVKGLKLFCRQSLVPQYPEDHPLSSHWDEMDALVVFEDVFIPWERVFYLRESHPEDMSVYMRLFQRVVAWAGWHILARLAVKAEVLTGICAAMVDYLGTSKQPPVQLALSDAIVYVETLRALISAAEHEAVPSPSGLLMPNPTKVFVGRVYGVQNLPPLLQMMRELCGSGILMSPTEEELKDPEIGPYIYRFFVGKDERAPERFRMLKLAWDYACDSFGGRQLLFEMYNARSLHTNRLGLAASYDLGPFVRLAKKLAGIE
ncbi:MAG TPA: 4-hydroxyphenylacetate 3-hydroxylase N-terminal domain-containing protein [Dehalococcoidia bacterium]|nr:4-hydroxyphenylacetate 3-hydroxylase N-terminal domain-containing protein [Dehalococcoidia bacterium]